MSRTWILDVLDRELPNLRGIERDRLADAILGALPVQELAAAVRTSALAALVVTHPNADPHKRLVLARDISNNAAISIVERLSEIDDDEAEPARSAAQ